jgi:hypothetical protein
MIANVFSMSSMSSYKTSLSSFGSLEIASFTSLLVSSALADEEMLEGEGPSLLATVTLVTVL